MSARLPYQRIIAFIATAVVSGLLLLSLSLSGESNLSVFGIPVLFALPALGYRPLKYLSAVLLLGFSFITSAGLFYLPCVVLMLWPETRDDNKTGRPHWSAHPHTCSKCGGMYTCSWPEYCPEVSGGEPVCRSCLG